MVGYAKAMTTSSLGPLPEQAKATSHNLSLVVEEVITALDETDVLQFEQYSLVRASLFASSCSAWHQNSYNSFSPFAALKTHYPYARTPLS